MGHKWLIVKQRRNNVIVWERPQRVPNFKRHQSLRSKNPGENLGAPKQPGHSVPRFLWAAQRGVLRMYSLAFAAVRAHEHDVYAHVDGRVWERAWV